MTTLQKFHEKGSTASSMLVEKHELLAVAFGNLNVLIKEKKELTDKIGEQQKCYDKIKEKNAKLKADEKILKEKIKSLESSSESNQTTIQCLKTELEQCQQQSTQRVNQYKRSLTELQKKERRILEENKRLLEANVALAKKLQNRIDVLSSDSGGKTIHYYQMKNNKVMTVTQKTSGKRVLVIQEDVSGEEVYKQSVINFLVKLTDVSIVTCPALKSNILFIKDLHQINGIEVESCNKYMEFLSGLFADFNGTATFIYSSEKNEFPQFYSLLERSQVANFTLMYRHATVFAPTNRAFQDYTKANKPRDLVLYHISNTAKTTDELGNTISSELGGNPPLWVTRKRVNHHEEIYINNAKILAGSDYKATIQTSNGLITQVLHKISEVLEPVQSNSVESLIDNPNAFQFLNQSNNLDIGRYRIRIFHQRVTQNQKEDIFKAEGGHTFFIPEEEGFKPTIRPHKVDHSVIDGHVIPNHVLFTAPTPMEVPYNTLANNDNLKVTISFFTDAYNKSKIYVKSNTLVGDTNHPTGVVIAEIVKPNIPVKNGVIHLIQRPLMVVDTTVEQFISSFKDKEDGPVYKFYQMIRDFGEDFMDSINKHHEITLFAPSNAAWSEEGVKNILQNKTKFKEILNLHFVKEKLPLDKIKQKSINQVPTAAMWKNLYFNVIEGSNGSQVVTVEGGGVNATVITANIAATDGIIHIIDRVLGIPYTTVLNKLKTDPMLNATYLLGTKRNFNEQLNDTKKRFTYFVPRDSAWDYARTSIPTPYAKLFMSEYSYHTKQILERHLIVSDKAYTMAELKKMTKNDSVLLSPMRDNLKLKIREYDGSYQIEWMGKWIRVIRPDVACTNGIIHVIDRAFLTPEDITVTDGTNAGSVIIFAPHLITIVIAKWFL